MDLLLAQATDQGFHFNGEVTLGAILTMTTIVITAIGLYFKLANKVDNHAAAITQHAEKLGDHDELITRLLQDVSRLIGWQEGQVSGRRQYPRLTYPQPDGEAPNGS